MTTAKKTPQDKKPKATEKPSELIDAELEQKELREELLAGLPALRPARRFRLGHRNAFTNLTLDAVKSGAFEGDGALEFDMSNKEDIERLQKLNDFVASIDEWAETIADDPDEYAAWSEGKTQEVFMALYTTYRDELGESSSSAS
jgi:hypothetical protein